MEDHDKKYSVKPMREHPKPPMGPVNSLNQAVRQELWFVDTMVATPFRTLRRQLQTSRGAWAQGADEAVWALEGMARLPVKLLQSAFGESMSAAGTTHSPAAGTTEPDDPSPSQAP